MKMHGNYDDESGIFKLFDEDGYCVCCGNGEWKAHMPGCEVADLLDEVERLRQRPESELETMERLYGPGRPT